MFPTEISTKIINGGAQTKPFYTAKTGDVVKISLTLESPGPCSVGTNASVNPVGSANGQLLALGRTMTFYLAPGQNLYAAADTPQRVAFIAEPLPWALEILESLKTFAAPVLSLVQRYLPKPPSLAKRKDC